ncbi:MAG TPA: ABC transporter substrate-binding protein [Stellaceae bacterium]|nr:ABC transporter substrate-binding protein [Stellaceae bacterium]
MRRRDFTTGLLLATAMLSARAEEPATQHRIAIVISTGPVARINDPGSRYWHAFFEELRRLGDVEGQNLIVERYSGEGRPAGFAELAREVVRRNPEVIVAIAGPVTLAVTAVTDTIPIVATGDETSSGVVPGLARPGGNVTGARVELGYEIWGKRLQILKEAVPSASKVAYLDIRIFRESASGQQIREQLRTAGRLLEISLTDILIEESTPSEYQRAFAEIVKDRPDAIVVSGTSELFPYRQLIVELADKNRLPGMYPWRDYAEAGGLMAYGTDLVEVWRRLADDVHEILDGAKPGDIPIYQPTKFEFLINLKAANTLGLTIPPLLLARADEVIE